MREDGDERDDDDDDRPRRRPASSGGGGLKIVLIVLGIVGILAVLCGGGLFGLLYYGVGKVRNAAEQVQAQNNVKQISIAMLNYHSANNTFPPNALKTKDGKPGLSWRVAILPYLESNSLYSQFKLDEPWDSPQNIKLLDLMPRVFASPSDPMGTMTHYRVFVGPGSLFERDKKVRIADITDGVSNTAMLVETADAVPWTKPDEVDWRPGGPLPAFGLPKHDYVLVALADGSVRRVNKKCSPETWHAVIGRNDNKLVPPDFFGD